MGDNQEERKDGAKFPLQVIYCAKCGLPPEYCEYGGKANDLDECKTWLQKTHPRMFEALYPTNDEEAKDENADSKPKKKKKGGVKFEESTDKKIRVITQKRGGKKMCTTIFGLEAYGCNLEEVAQ